MNAIYYDFDNERQFSAETSEAKKLSESLHLSKIIVTKPNKRKRRNRIRRKRLRLYSTTIIPQSELSVLRDSDVIGDDDIVNDDIDINNLDL